MKEQLQRVFEPEDGNADPPPIRVVDGRAAPDAGVPVGCAPVLNTCGRS